MKNSKRYAAISCSILLLTASLTACNSSASKTSNTLMEENSINSILETLQSTEAEYGKVTAIQGSTITLALGELSGGGGPGGEGSGGPGGNPDGNTSESASADGSNPGGKAPGGNTQSGEVPSGEAPKGGSSGNEAPSGEAPNGGTSGNEAPSGEAPNGGTSGDEAPSGEAPGRQTPAGGMSSSFTENGETLTLTISDESIIKIQNGTEDSEGSLTDIQVGAIVSFEYADDGSLSSLTIQNIS